MFAASYLILRLYGPVEAETIDFVNASPLFRLDIWLFIEYNQMNLRERSIRGRARVLKSMEVSGKPSVLVGAEAAGDLWRGINLVRARL